VDRVSARSASGSGFSRSGQFLRLAGDE